MRTVNSACASGKAAAALSALFADASHSSAMHKRYCIEVKGELPASGEFRSPLDGKAAQTRYRCLDHDPKRASSKAEVELITGRKHQIRRHFADAGFPVLGDPRYGSGNGDSRGLQLRAVALSFTCPLTGQQRHYTAPATG